MARRPQGDPYAPHQPGVLRLNPLYAATARAGGLDLHLSFPSPEYEDEFGACRRYLPEHLVLTEEVRLALEAGSVTPEILSLVERRIVLELPDRYA